MQSPASCGGGDVCWDDTSHIIDYEGPWHHQIDTVAFNGTVSVSDTIGDSAKIVFTGSPSKLSPAYIGLMSGFLRDFCGGYWGPEWGPEGSHLSNRQRWTFNCRPAWI